MVCNPNLHIFYFFKPSFDTLIFSYTTNCVQWNGWLKARLTLSLHHCVIRNKVCSFTMLVFQELFICIDFIYVILLFSMPFLQFKSVRSLLVAWFYFLFLCFFNCYPVTYYGSYILKLKISSSIFLRKDLNQNCC